MKGLEPPRCYPPDPKSGASANSATSAYLIVLNAYMILTQAPPNCQAAVIPEISGFHCRKINFKKFTQEVLTNNSRYVIL